MDNFMELLMTRKSIRKYKDRPIEREKLDTIIDACMTSPTGHNTRAWELVLVEDKSILEKLSKARGFHSRFIKDAAVGFIVIGDTEQAATWQEDTAILGTIIQLTGHSLGLGSCWIETHDVIADDGSNMEENIREILNIPSDRYRIQCMISMGYADEIRRRHNKDKFRYEKIHYESFNK